MPNNRKPKLAPGSRWEDEDTILDSGDAETTIEEGEYSLSPYIVTEAKDGERQGTFVLDALAAIRAAKLDPVFDSSVALAGYWDGFVPEDREALWDRYPVLFKLLDANSIAVQKATE
jgi:hypothetical protein